MVGEELDAADITERGVLGVAAAVAVGGPISRGDPVCLEPAAA